MRQRKIGFVFQKFNLLPTLDARSNIAIAQEISGNGRGDPSISRASRICSDLPSVFTIDLRNFPAESSSAWRWRER